MMQILDINDQPYKFDAESGRTWFLGQDDDENPEWVEIKDRQEKADA